ncbi:MAG: 2-phosphosulfolactate phosphatase [Pirellulales bacterium]
MARLSVHLLPDLVDESELAGKTVVVIDVLRATTTITYALAAGAAQVIPCLEIEDARRTAAEFPRDQVLLGGERGGVRIEGFDLGNSPEEYSPEIVRGKSIVFTTTNGTRAMMRCRQAKRVLIGAVVNLSAVADAVRDEENVHLVCAGTEGQVSCEDTLLAGVLVAKPRRGISGLAVNDAAQLAEGAFRALMAVGASPAEFTVRKLHEALKLGLGGRNVLALGRDQDLLAAAQIDKFDFVPELDLADWSIRRPSPAR